jgi:hypothetical protein
VLRPVLSQHFTKRSSQCFSSVGPSAAPSAAPASPVAGGSEYASATLAPARAMVPATALAAPPSVEPRLPSTDPGARLALAWHSPSTAPVSDRALRLVLLRAILPVLRPASPQCGAYLDTERLAQWYSFNASGLSSSQGAALSAV